jgi:hypothetical protein
VNIRQVLFGGKADTRQLIHQKISAAFHIRRMLRLRGHTGNAQKGKKVINSGHGSILHPATTPTQAQSKAVNPLT